MKLNGEQVVPAGQLRAWEALNDPEVLKQCIPGCDGIVLDGENAYKVGMSARIGPISAKFNGKLRVFDIVAPVSYSLEFEGQGGVAGFGKGIAAVRLDSIEENETKMIYTVEAVIGGKLAQVGARLIDSATKKLSDEFFGNLTALLKKSAEPHDDISPDGDHPEVASAWRRLFKRDASPISKKEAL